MSNTEIGLLIALLACIIGGLWVVIEKKKRLKLEGVFFFYLCLDIIKEASRKFFRLRPV